MINSKGFSLIELVLVMTILSVLVGVLLPDVLVFVDRANEVVDKVNAKTCYTSALLSWTSNKTEINDAIIVPSDCVIIDVDTRGGDVLVVEYSGDNFDPTISVDVPLAARYGDWIYNSEGHFSLGELVISTVVN